MSPTTTPTGMNHIHQDCDASSEVAAAFPAPSSRSSSIREAYSFITSSKCAVVGRHAASFSNLERQESISICAVHD